MDERKLDAVLRAVLYRRNCPDTMALNDYQMGVLAEPEQGRVRAHLNRCPHCRSELGRLATFLAAEASSPLPKSNWSRAVGFEWGRVRETGAVVIRLLGEALAPPRALQPAPITLKGQARSSEETDIVRHIILGPDETGDLDIEAIIRCDRDDPELCTLVARVQDPSRWPELAGTLVRVSAGAWRAEGTTDDEGVVTLAGLARDLLDQLSITVVPSNPVRDG